MLGASGEPLSARTDVYLLGAVLYEVIAGQAPHRGATVEAIMSSVLLSEPPFPSDAPPELETIARACMKRDPSARPESALAVRLALEDFLEHQGSVELTLGSEAKLAEMEALLAHTDHDVGQLFNLFAECRFGFRQALRAWEKNERARAGLQRCVRLMIKYEIDRGAGHAALTLIGDLGTKDEALEAEVKRAVEEEEAKGARLEKLERDHDVRTGGRIRLVAGLSIGIIWALSPFAGKFLATAHPTYEALFAVPIAVFTALLAIVSTHLVRVGRTPLNRALFRVVVFSMGVQAVGLTALHFAYGDPGVFGVPAMALYWSVICGMIAVALDWRVWSIAAAYGLSGIVALRFPDRRYEATALANTFFAVASAIIWSRPALEREAVRQKKADARWT
jgi:serine/threonine-protein kinase